MVSQAKTSDARKAAESLSRERKLSQLLPFKRVTVLSHKNTHAIHAGGTSKHN